VSDTLASALWAVDVMMQFAAAGCAGVNFHGGGNGYYTPIAGSLATGFHRRPECFGMEIVKQFVGASVQQSTLTCADDRVRAYAARKSSAQLMLAINKTNQPVAVQTPIRRAHEQWILSGRAIDAKDGVELTSSRATALRGGILHIAPFSALLIVE
jgi:hypothetical protein